MILLMMILIRSFDENDNNDDDDIFCCLHLFINHLSPNLLHRYILMTYVRNFCSDPELLVTCDYGNLSCDSNFLFRNRNLNDIRKKVPKQILRASSQTVSKMTLHFGVDVSFRC